METPNLLPMEEHKQRALRHLLRRAGRPLNDFVAAVEDVAEHLESAYMDLGADWGGRERFLETMIVDGCFLLEVMMTAAGRNVDDYGARDPIFSTHGIRYMGPYIRRDMLMLENQLPLLLLQKLNTVESGRSQNVDFINKMVLRFVAPSSRPLQPGIGLGLHPLDIFRRSMLFGEYQRIRSSSGDTEDNDGILLGSAVKLSEAGILFKTSKSTSLYDIRFHHGVLSMPTVPVDDSTEYMFLNIMAFERLHVGARNDVTAYVFFMTNMVDSAHVALLRSRGIVQNAVGSDKAVAKLFNGLSREMVLEPDSALDAVGRKVNGYLRRPRNVWRAGVGTCFRSPWALLSVAGAVLLLVVMAIVQTVYTVLQFYQDR